MFGASDSMSIEGQNRKSRKTLKRLTSPHKVISMFKWIFSCYKAKNECSYVCQYKGRGNSSDSNKVATTSTFKSIAPQRELAIDITSSNISSAVNERQLGGKLDTFTHNNLCRSTNRHTVDGGSAPNLYAPPSKIPLSPAVQMAAMAQPQANKFAPPRKNTPLPAVPIAAMAQHQANLFGPSSKIPSLPSLPMATIGPSSQNPSLPSLQVDTMGPSSYATHRPDDRRGSTTNKTHVPVFFLNPYV